MNSISVWICLSLALVLTSCYEEATLIDDLQNGALVEVPSDISFALDSAGTVSFEVEALENNEGDLASVDVRRQLFLGGEESDVSDLVSLSSFPAMMDESVTDLVSGIQVGGSDVTTDDLTPGTVLELTYQINMSDGRSLRTTRTTAIVFE